MHLIALHYMALIAIGWITLPCIELHRRAWFCAWKEVALCTHVPLLLLNSTLQILNFAFQRPVHCSALQFCVFYVHIFTLAALYFPFQQGKNLQIWVSSVHVRGDLDPLKKGGATARLNSALSVMELIAPLVINIISNVINGNIKLLKITPLKLLYNQSMTHSWLVIFVKIWHFESLMLTYICWKGGLVPSTPGCGWWN